MEKIKLNNNLKLIVCVGPNNIIGDKYPKGNGMLWHIKEELLYFKSLTLGNTLLFGASTAKVVPVELMKKDREVIILHRSMDVPKLLEELTEQNKTIFVCGGSSIYRYFLENFYIDEIYLSKIKENVKVKEATEALYLPNIEDYGYEIVSAKDYDEFTAYVYKLKNK
ncbi:MAG: dihydrofolate reductase family protein [Fusobacterium sp.]|uniref:dihydrofolate reductase n=1 Tax=Fusobacterium sp. TaxID=68766 RepID=UPI0026DD3B72|nr:dihydrofolate reductase family protein [Fusobacterium sp.]MDO4690409.1 dihydrofolate reductase family protein [Fusobacterium sp.]